MWVRCGPGGADYNANAIPDDCEAQCSANTDCDDGSACTCDRCLCGVCVHQPITFGDTNCDCIPPNLDDILCVLGGFADFALCPAANIHPPCTGDGDIDLDDILSVLSAFGGTNPCVQVCNVSCPTGACCNETSCSQESLVGCLQDGFTFKGENSTCLGTNPCP